LKQGAFTIITIELEHLVHRIAEDASVKFHAET
jgi:hypothetical protein